MMDQLNCLGRLPPPPGGWRGRQSASRTSKRGHVPRIQLLPWEHSTASGLARVCSLHGISRQPPRSGGWSNPDKDDNSEDWEERQDRRHTHRHQIYNNTSKTSQPGCDDRCSSPRPVPPRRSTTPPSCQGLHHRPPRGSAIYLSFNLSPPIRAPGLRAPTPFLPSKPLPQPYP